MFFVSSPELCSHAHNRWKRTDKLIKKLSVKRGAVVHADRRAKTSFTIKCVRAELRHTEKEMNEWYSLNIKKLL